MLASFGIVSFLASVIVSHKAKLQTHTHKKRTKNSARLGRFRFWFWFWFRFRFRFGFRRQILQDLLWLCSKPCKYPLQALQYPKPCNGYSAATKSNSRQQQHDSTASGSKSSSWSLNRNSQFTIRNSSLRILEPKPNSFIGQFHSSFWAHWQSFSLSLSHLKLLKDLIAQFIAWLIHTVACVGFA